LAIAIGANSALYCAIRSTILQGLPFRNPDTLAFIGVVDKRADGQRHMLGPTDLIELGRHHEIFAQVGGFISDGNTRFDVQTSEHTVRVQGAMISANLPKLLGVPPTLGRAPEETDEEPGPSPVVLLGYDFWRRHFGSDPSLIGKSIRINDKPYAVIGVMPGGFSFPLDAELWFPWAFFSGKMVPVKPGIYSGSFGVGRLADGISLRSAAARVGVIGQNLVAADSGRSGQALSVTTLATALVGDIARPMMLLLGAVGFVLLIACANIGNLMLGRAVARRPEFALRTSMGASRASLVWQVIAEGGVLAASGGLLALPVAEWMLKGAGLLLRHGLATAPSMHIDVWVVGFTVGVTALAAVCFSAAPAMSASRVELNSRISEGARGASHGTAARLLEAFAAAEVALALTLCIGGALMLKGLARVTGRNLGFDPHGILTATLARPPLGDEALRAAEYDRALAGLLAIPHVERAAVTSALPFSGDKLATPVLGEAGRGLDGSRQAIARCTMVSDQYFEAMRIPLLAGRPFSRADDERSPRVVIVDTTLARELWPGEEPIGKRLAFEGTLAKPAWRLVVGVSAHVSEYYRKPSAPGEMAEMLIPFRQSTIPPPSVSFAIRAGPQPLLLAGAIRSSLLAAQPKWALDRLESMDERLASLIGQQRSVSVLLALFSLTALGLAAMGVYGVQAYSVSERRREIGIRMALGAQRWEILLMILQRAAFLATIGAAFGVLGALGLAKLLHSLLYEAVPIEMNTFAMVAVGLILIALLAAGCPALRATRVDPIAALRDV